MSGLFYSARFRAGTRVWVVADRFWEDVTPYTGVVTDDVINDQDGVYILRDGAEQRAWYRRDDVYFTKRCAEQIGILRAIEHDLAGWDAIDYFMETDRKSHVKK